MDGNFEGGYPVARETANASPDAPQDGQHVEPWDPSAGSTPTSREPGPSEDIKPTSEFPAIYPFCTFFASRCFRFMY